MDTATFLVQCLNAVQYGLLLFLVASGLTLIFGIMGVINLAHGSFYMLGAYLAFALAPWFGDWFVTRLVVGVPLAALFGYLLEWVFFSFLYERDHLQQVLLTYALILVFEELRSLARRQRRARRPGAGMADRRLPSRRPDGVPVVPRLRVGGVPRRRARALRRRQPRRGSA